MQMRWIAASAVRTGELDQVGGGTCIPATGENARVDGVLVWRLSSGAHGRAARCVSLSPGRQWPLGQAEPDEIFRAENARVGGAP
jgi:hypothetical protein